MERERRINESIDSFQPSQGPTELFTNDEGNTYGGPLYFTPPVVGPNHSDFPTHCLE